MGPLWCWRCKREVLMLDEEEYQQVFMLFNTGIGNGRERLFGPMTPEQIEAEAAYAKEIHERLSNPSPEETRKIFEAIERRKRSKAASRSHQKSNVNKPEA